MSTIENPGTDSRSVRQLICQNLLVTTRSMPKMSWGKSTHRRAENFAKGQAAPSKTHQTGGSLRCFLKIVAKRLLVANDEAAAESCHVHVRCVTTTRLMDARLTRAERQALHRIEAYPPLNRPLRRDLVPDDRLLTLSAEVSRLFEKWGELAVVSAVEAARTSRPRGPKPMADHCHVLQAVGIMLLHAFQEKYISSDEAVRIYIQSLTFRRPKEREAMAKRLRRKLSENWFGVALVLSILYEAFMMRELTEGHTRYLCFAFSNWWCFRKLSRDPAEITKFWGLDNFGHLKPLMLGPFSYSRFSVFDL